MFSDNIKQVSSETIYPEIDLMLLCDFNNIETIRKVIDYLLKWTDIKAIVSFIDPFCSLAAKFSNEYKLNNFSYLAMEKMQNKLLCRQALDKTKYNPKYKIINNNNYLDFNEIQKMLPVVVKYIESNGSKDVYYCSNIDNYRHYVEHLFKQYGNCICLVEEFLNGPQYIVEAVAIKNHIIIEAIIEQEIEFVNDHFIITGYSLGLNYPKEFISKLKKSVDEILKLHNFENGPCHLEMRYVDDNWKLIEINPRISGAGMNNFLQIGLGYSLVEEHLKLTMNQDYNFEPRHEIHTFAEYITLNRNGTLERITGKEKVLTSEGVKFVFVKPKKGTYLTTPISLGDRYAYIIATGETKENARENAKNAAKKMHFHLL